VEEANQLGLVVDEAAPAGHHHCAADILAAALTMPARYPSGQPSRRNQPGSDHAAVVATFEL
jgi:hypothetical protein